MTATAKRISMRDLTVLATALNAEVSDNGIDAYDGFAPIGSVWQSSGNHMLLSCYAEWHRIEKGAKAEARLDMHQQMSYGLIPCPTKAAGNECDYCDEL